MAGSYEHLKKDAGGVLDYRTIENMGDAYEALEHCFYMIEFLTTDAPGLVEHASEQAYRLKRGDEPHGRCRMVQIFREGNWVAAKFDELAKGDIFQLINYHGQLEDRAILFANTDPMQDVSGDPGKMTISSKVLTTPA